MALFEKSPQVDAVPEAGPRIPANPDNGYGALGQGIASASDALGTIAARSYRDQVEADVSGAVADFQKRLNVRMWDDKTGFMHTKGENAFDADKELPKAVQQDFDEISAKLRSTAARGIFSKKVQPSMLAAQMQVENHVFQQGQVVKDANHKARVASTFESIDLNPDQANIYLIDGAREVAAYNAHLGDEAQLAAVKDLVSTGREKQVKALLRSNRFAEAKLLFDSREAEFGAKASKVHEEILQAWLPQQAMEIADDITTKVVNPETGRVDEAMKRQLVGKVKDARLRKEVETQLKANITLADDQFTQGTGDLYTQLYDRWKSTWSKKGMGPGLAALRRRGKQGADFHRQLESVMEEDIKDAEERREKGQNGPMTPAQRESRLQLWSFMSEHDEVIRDPSMTPNVFLTKFTSGMREKDKDFFDKLYIEIRSKNWDTSVPKRALDYVNSQFRERFGSKWTLKTATPEEQNYYDATVQQIMQRVMAARSEGDELSDRDMKAIADQQFESSQGTFYGLMGRQYRYEAAAEGTLGAFVPEAMQEALESDAIRLDFARRLTSLGRYGTVSPESTLVDQAISEHYNQDFNGGVVQPQPLQGEDAAPVFPAPDAQPEVTGPPPPGSDESYDARVELANRTAELAAAVEEEKAAAERQLQADIASAMAQGAEYDAAVAAAQGLAVQRQADKAKKKRDDRTVWGIYIAP